MADFPVTGERPYGAKVRNYVDAALVAAKSYADTVAAAAEAVASGARGVADAANAKIDGHIAKIVDAHLATAIKATPNSGSLTGTDVQTQLSQAATQLTSIQSTLSTLPPPAGAVGASNVTYGGGPTLPASSVEVALDALDARGYGVTTGVAEGVNLNTLVTPGQYARTSSVNNTVALNYPVDNWAGYIEVFTSGGQLIQRATSLVSGPGGSAVFGNAWFRTRFGGSWYPWTRVVTSEGDTGWRDITPGPNFVVSPVAPMCQIRREDRTVSLRFRLRPAPAVVGTPMNNPGSHTVVDLPTGFTTGSYTPHGAAMIGTGRIVPVATLAARTSLHLYTNRLDPTNTWTDTTDSDVTGSVSWVTPDPWPTTLP